jgi:hypothetical protein
MPTTTDDSTVASTKSKWSIGSIAGDLVAIDLRSLATFRIGIGIAIVVDTVVRAFDLVEPTRTTEPGPGNCCALKTARLWRSLPTTGPARILDSRPRCSWLRL